MELTKVETRRIHLPIIGTVDEAEGVLSANSNNRMKNATNILIPVINKVGIRSLYE